MELSVDKRIHFTGHGKANTGEHEDPNFSGRPAAGSPPPPNNLKDRPGLPPRTVPERSLLKLDGSAGFFQLLLNLFSFLFLDAFFDSLRS